MLRAIPWIAVSTAAQTEEDRYSLPAQEKHALELIQRENWRMVDQLWVPGHSRRFIDFHELVDTAAKKGIDAFGRLEQHWKARDFDVLIVRDGDRFARTQSLFAYITESVIQSGAQIYSFSDGWITPQNYRMWIAMRGHTASSYIDSLVKMSQDAKEGKAARGVITSARIAWSHKNVRNERNSPVKTVPDESKRLILEDAARLVIEGVGWFHIEKELHERYGHTNNGKPFGGGFFYQLFHNPIFWGNAARRYKDSKRHGQKTDLWVFDPSIPAPPHVMIVYGALEPALTGELATKLQAELRRRRSTIRGSARPRRTKAFSGLLVCGVCGYYMTFMDNGQGYGFYRCPSTYVKGNRPKCPGVTYTPERTIKAYFDEALRIMLQTQNPFYLLEDDSVEQQAASADMIQVRIDDIQARLRRLIEKQSTADGAVSDLYDEQIDALGNELKLARKRLAEAEREMNSAAKREAQAAYGELEALTLAKFWNSEPTFINQILHRLMGPRRLRINDKQVTQIITPT